jgi:hypothetical protein
MPPSSLEEESEEICNSKKDKTFRLCPDCTERQADEQPYMVLASHWEVHLNGKTHRASLRAKGGRRTEKTGPEVDAKRRERQARKGISNSSGEE